MLFQKICLEPVVLQIAEYADKEKKGQRSWFKRHAPTSSYPNRTIRLVVPFVPGGGVDTLARMFAEKMQPKLGVSVIVENWAGASGNGRRGERLSVAARRLHDAVLVQHAFHGEADDAQGAVWRLGEEFLEVPI